MGLWLPRFLSYLFRFITGSVIYDQSAPVCIKAQSSSLQRIKMEITIATDKNLHSILYMVTHER